MMRIFLLMTLLAQCAACASQASEIVVIAHRGASGVAPESTLYAYQEALKLSVDYLEGDVQRTRDGVLVLFHDAFLNADTDVEIVFPEMSQKPIEAFTWAQLQELSNGKWFNRTFKDRARPQYDQAKILRLEELLKILSPHAGPGLYLETKRAYIHTGIEKDLVDLLTRYGWLKAQQESSQPRVIFQSFEKDSLAQLEQLAPDFPRVYLVSPDLLGAMGMDKIIADAKAVNAYAVGPAGYSCWPWNMSAWHDAGLKVHTYTLNQSWQYALVHFFGVDGIFTDYPQRLMDYLERD